jgi:tetratricopeptide (TPR) repeat protein
MHESSFGQQLRALRHERGMSLSDLARAVHYSKSYLSRIETGVKPATADLANRCDDVLAGGGRLRSHLASASERTPSATGYGQPPADHPVPRQLPSDAYGFTGRTDQIAEISRLVDRATAGGVTPVIVLSGTAGVGKTALALHWSRRVAQRFPDGQLYVDLHGHDPDRHVDTDDVLARLLRALGVGAADIAYDGDERAAQWRTVVADRRLVLVADNARDSAHVRPLLPASPRSAILVTSRDRLTGLVARDGAFRIDIPRLTDDQALELLENLLGSDACRERSSALAVVRRCAGLPLALRVAADHTYARSPMSLAQLAGALRSEQHRLDLLHVAGDGRTALRTVFSCSYRQLDATSAALFRLFGAAPHAEVDLAGLAAMLDTGPDVTRRAIAALIDTHLVEPVAADRFRMHDLLRAYAGETVEPHEASAALDRLFTWYVASAVAAADAVVDPHRRSGAPGSAPVTGEAMAAEPALAWLMQETPNVPAVVRCMAAQGRPEHVVRLATALSRYLDSAGCYPEALALHSHSLIAARDLDDRIGEADALRRLGTLYWRWGRTNEATDNLQRSLSIRLTIGDRAGQAGVLHDLGNIAARDGDYPKAQDLYEQALAIQHELGNATGEGLVHHSLGNLCWRRGQASEAHRRFAHALTLFDQIGDRSRRAGTLNNMALIHIEEGNHGEAQRLLGESLQTFRATGHRVGEATTLDSLGQLHRLTGQLDDARRCYEESLRIAREIGERRAQPGRLNSLGSLARLAGERAQAEDYHRAALVLAERLRAPAAQAEAHNGIAVLFAEAGDDTAAYEHFRRAAEIATSIGDARQQEMAADGLARLATRAQSAGGEASRERTR